MKYISAEQFRRKSRKAMANPKTRSVKVGRFIVTPHAQNQMIERDIPNETMIRNLCRKPVAKTPVKIDTLGRPSYKRLNNESAVVINPINKKAATIHALKKEDAKKYSIKRIHMKTESELAAERKSKKKKKK